MRQLLAELRAVQKLTTTVYQEISRLWDWASDIGQLLKNKNTNVKFRDVPDLVKQSIVNIKFVETNLTLADIMKKSVHGPKFTVDFQRLGVADQCCRSEKLPTQEKIS